MYIFNLFADQSDSSKNSNAGNLIQLINNYFWKIFLRSYFGKVNKTFSLMEF